MVAPRMFLRVGTVLTAVLLLTAGPAIADSWLALESGAAAAAPQLSVRASDLTQLSVAAQTYGLALTTHETELGEFVELGWPGDTPTLGAIGSPQMPVIRRLFVAPAGATVSFDYHAGVGQLIDSALPVFAVQPPVEKLPGALEKARFVFDEKAYAIDADLPAERVVVEELGIVRGQRLFLLEIRPVAYNPARGTLTVYADITVAIHFDGGLIPRDAINPLPGMQRFILNPEVLPQVNSRQEGEYLIVVGTAYQSDIASFAAAKEDQGFDVTTYVTASSSAATIKAWIQGEWNAGTHWDYILLVGDTNTIGAFVGGGDGSPDTDLQYGCMDGSTDWYPDIAVGRFPVRSSADVNAVVAKTLYYENGPLSDPDYLLRAVFMASSDNYTVSEGTHNYCINTYLEPLGYTYDKLYCHTYNATTQQVRDAYNNGRFFGIFSGHGATTYWADGPTFYQSDVNNLTNADMYSFICSFSCSTGDYVATECFTETWVLAPNKAAVTSWGSSVSSYWTEDDILEKRLFDVIFDPDPNAVVNEVGPIYNETKMRYLDHFGSSSFTRRYFEMYNLMGDPSLWVVEQPEPASGMVVTPGTGMESTGNYGGPFTPPSAEYTLENRNETAIGYEVSTLAEWLDISDPVGTIPGLGTVAVTVSINSQADTLENGVYTALVWFDNTTDGDGDTMREVTLTIGVPTLQYEWTMDENPGWTTEGSWAWGIPAGQGGQYGYADPTSGHTGANVYGYNLYGDYENGMPERHLTTLAIDCGELSDVSLRFWRWLGVERSQYDHAYVRASTNGTIWHTLWQNSTANTTDSSWQYQDYDISDVADYQSTLYIRWTMGTTDGSWQYCGWNVDDVEIWALAPQGPAYELGDLNCDGEVNFGDINPFVLALTSPAEYATAYPECDINLADIDGSDEVDFGDINPFVALLSK